MAGAAIARKAGTMAAKQAVRGAVRGAQQAARNVARQGMNASRRAAQNAAQQGVKNYAQQAGKGAWKAAAKSAPGRALGRTVGTARRVGARVRPLLGDIAQMSQVAAGLAPYLADYGGPRGKQVAAVLSDETKYNVGGKSMSRKELMEELAKAEKAMAAMETTEA